MHRCPTKAEARAIIDRCARDPIFFSRHALGAEPVGLSRRIMKAVAENDEVSVASAHSLTKSWTAAALTLWWGSTRALAKVITTATKQLQVKGVVWDEIDKLGSGAVIPLGAEILTTEIKWRNGSRAFGMTAAPNTQAGFQGFRGAGGTLAIVDEAPGVARPILDGIYSMLTGANGKLLMIGNPTDPNGAFADSFKRAGVCKIQISAFESHNVEPYGVTVNDIADPKWEDRLREKGVPPKRESPFPFLATAYDIRKWWEVYTSEGARMNDPRWVARVLGRFPSETEDTLIPMTWIDAAFELFDEVEAGKVSREHFELGEDVSDEGEDAMSIAFRRGPYARIEKHLIGNDPIAAGDIAAEVFRKHGVTKAKIDSIGVGAGTFAYLRKLGFNVERFDAGESALDDPSTVEKFRNRRAQGWWSLRERFFESYCMVRDRRPAKAPFIALERNEHSDRLAGDLNAIRWFMSNNQITLEPKVETKKRLGRSPDDGDALMMAFAPGARRIVIV